MGLGGGLSADPDPAPEPEACRAECLPLHGALGDGEAGGEGPQGTLPIPCQAGLIPGSRQMGKPSSLPRGRSGLLLVWKVGNDNHTHTLWCQAVISASRKHKAG